ncbi:multidrug effflux MFS transporter [Nisaea sp.]|uniref:multidrug effflux MFS transporter n=1 Tax=Nisaea sp. TaxID=2024842 RepID=UPI003267B39E
MQKTDFRVDSASGIATLTLLVALGQMSVGLVIPSLPSMVDYFKTDIGTVQLTLTVHFTAFAFFQLLAGPLSDRFGRRPIVLTGLAISVAGALACALSTTIWALIGSRVLLAIGVGSGGVIARAVIRDKTNGTDAARIMSFIGMAMALSPALTPTIGGQLEGFFGWQAAFIFMAAIAGMMFLFCLLRLPETIPQKNLDAMRLGGMLSAYRSLIVDRRFAGYAALNSCIFGMLFAYQTGSPYILMMQLGYSPQAYGLLILFNVAGFLTGTIFSNRFGRQIGIYNMVRIGGILGLISGIAMFIPAQLGHVSAVAIIGPSVLLLVALGITVPNSMAGALQHFPHIAGVASALLGFLQMGAGAVGSLFISSLQNLHPMVMPDLFAVAGVLGVVSVMLIPRPGESKD